MSLNQSGSPKNVCVVSVLRDEEKFLDEWLVYHRMMGADHFFLYDDDPQLNLTEFLLPHGKYVTVIPWHEDIAVKGYKKSQIQAFKHALNNHIAAFEWVIFMDADEFIVLKQHDNISGFLADYGQANAVTLNWHMFGHNGFYDDPDRLITASLTRRMLAPYPDGKTFSRTSAISGIPSPHYCDLKNGDRVDANHKLYAKEIYPGKSDIAHINHYSCRSFLRWMKRASRGDVNFYDRNCPKSELWRLSEEGVMKEFITNIAKNYNEHVDGDLVKLKYEVQAGINALHRLRNQLPAALANDLKQRIDHQLALIANLIIKNGIYVEKNGLYNGKAGMAIFLFHYARYSKQNKYEQFALNLINEIVDQTTADSDPGYGVGVAGYGVVLEYLVKNSFINVDTNEILEDIDILIAYNLKLNTPANAGVSTGLAGLCKYFIHRINNPFNDLWHPREAINAEILDDTLNGLDIGSYNHHELLSLIHILAEVHNHADLEATKNLMHTATNLLIECAALLNEHKSIETFCFILNVVTIMKNVAGLTKNDFYNAAAENIKALNNYQEALKITDVNILPVLWLNYMQLYNQQNDKENKLIAVPYLEQLVSEIENVLENPDHITDAVWLSRMGLSLLPAVDIGGHQWLSLMPVLSDFYGGI